MRDVGWLLLVVVEVAAPSPARSQGRGACGVAGLVLVVFAVLVLPDGVSHGFGRPSPGEGGVAVLVVGPRALSQGLGGAGRPILELNELINTSGS